MKHNLISICLFFFALQSFANERNTDQYTLESYAKIKSIKKTSQDALLMYRETGATSQQMAVPYVFLSLMGHPNYSGLSPDHNLCAFIYGTPIECKKKYIFMAKLLPTNNVRKIVESLGGAVEEYQGWTLFAKSRDDFKIIKDKKWFLTYANERAKADIEFGIKPDIIPLTKFKVDKKLDGILNNIDKSNWSMDVAEHQIVLEGVLNYKKKDSHLGNWLINNANEPGMTTKVLYNRSRESKVRIDIGRKSLRSLFDQFRVRISSVE